MSPVPIPRCMPRGKRFRRSTRESRRKLVAGVLDRRAPATRAGGRPLRVAQRRGCSERPIGGPRPGEGGCGRPDPFAYAARLPLSAPAGGERQRPSRLVRESARARQSAPPVVNDSLVLLNSLQPDLIDEACYIEADGPRAGGDGAGHRRPVSDLSPDETGNPFFTPTFQKERGDVYQGSPYRLHRTPYAGSSRRRRRSR